MLHHQVKDIKKASEQNALENDKFYLEDPVCEPEQVAVRTALVEGIGALHGLFLPGRGAMILTAAFVLPLSGAIVTLVTGWSP
jgi:hypothetical protein